MKSSDGEAIQPHAYSPDYQAMGDCRVCGHERGRPWHAASVLRDSGAPQPRVEPVKTNVTQPIGSPNSEGEAMRDVEMSLAEEFWRHEAETSSTLSKLRGQNRLINESEKTQEKWLGFARIALRYASRSSVPPLAAGTREEIARIINPDLFIEYDLLVKQATLAENGKLWAEVVFGKKIEALLAKADAILSLPAAQTDDWQSIETAPKDGTHILAYRLPIGIRATNMTNPPTVVHWLDDGFYTSVNERAPEYPFNPTHWMPLLGTPALSRPQSGGGA